MGAHSKCTWVQEVGEIVDDLGSVPLHVPRLAQRHDAVFAGLPFKNFSGVTVIRNPYIHDIPMFYGKLSSLTATQFVKVQESLR